MAGVKKRRDLRESQAGLAAYSFRVVAILFALLMLICLPLFFVYISLVPVSEPGILNLLSFPLKSVLGLIGVAIVGFIILATVITARNLKK